MAKTECKFDQESRVYGVNGISPTLAARDSRGPKKILISQTTKDEKCSINKLFKEENVSPILTTAQEGNTQPKIICAGNINPSGRGMNGNVFDVAGGLAPTLTTNKGEGLKILISQNTKKGYIEYKGEDIELPCICASRGRNPINPSSRIAGLPTEQFLEINKNGTSNTITTVQKDNYAIEKNYRVRKLTPLECWRLMAFTDEDFFKAKNVGISNSQLYKQAGNSIVVKVLEGIFKELFLSEKENNERDFEIIKLGNIEVEQFKWVI